MHHRMLDHFAGGRTPVHRLDPAAKTVALLAAVLATVLLGREHFLPLLPTVIALAAYHALARAPVWYVARRLLVVSPFAAAIVVLFPFLEPGRAVWTLPLGTWTVEVTQEGLLRAAHLGAKFLLCAWATVLLLATTRFQDVLQALGRLRVPRVFVVQLAFLYRYLWLLLDEGMRLRMARAARDGGAGPWRLRFQSSVGVVGVLFLRTYDRAERIYWAMTARGFDGTLHGTTQAHMHATDWIFVIGVCAAAVAVVVWDRVAYG
ncbi:MAG TPA: cobalt ECF transporter T component CbiQ [Phycisphaerae bacterium]|nr:cobalt ECF transporter T component CbiQ [Phycisphaerae bacterium]